MSGAWGWPGAEKVGLTVPTTGPAGAPDAKPPLTMTGAAGLGGRPGAEAAGVTSAPGNGGWRPVGVNGALTGFCVGIITSLGGVNVFDCSGAGGMGGVEEGVLGVKTWELGSGDTEADGCIIDGLSGVVESTGSGGCKGPPSGFGSSESVGVFVFGSIA